MKITNEAKKNLVAQLFDEDLIWLSITKEETINTYLIKDFD